MRLLPLPSPKSWVAVQIAVGALALSLVVAVPAALSRSLPAVAWGEVAQMTTAIAAIAALFVSPWLTRRNTRALAEYDQRHRWLDAIRADVADFISMASPSVDREKMDALEARIWLRLDTSNPKHDRLKEKLEAVRNAPADQRAAAAHAILMAMDEIVAEVRSRFTE